MRVSLRMKRRNLKTTAGNRIPVFARLIALAAVFALFASLGMAQSKPKKGEPQTRTLKGVVTTADGSPAAKAVVLLENSKTKMIISFNSQDDGSYYFHELSPDVDYKVSARLNDNISATRTLSSFDSRREAVINLKLDKKK